MIDRQEKVAGIVLAAGCSSRMGRPKQLLEVEGQHLLNRILAEALDSELDLVVLVLGAHEEDIRSGLATDLTHPGLRVIQNPRHAEGISTSIIAGIKAVESTHNQAMVILADMPGINHHLINQLLQEFVASGLPLGAISLKGRRSHPVIFKKSLFPELKRLKGDSGARHLFTRYADRVCLVEPAGPYDDADIDTPRDYAAFLKTLG
jgi:molybdenum cofactor cytidylyltransferase